MASTALRTFAKDVPSCLKIRRLEHVRHGHHLRGKPPTIALTLNERLELLKKTDDPPISFRVNIGFSASSISAHKRRGWISERGAKRSDVKFQKQLKNGNIPLNLDEAREIWLDTCSPLHVRRIAEHYGIFHDLFGDAFFLPVVPLDINYRVGDDSFIKVYTGNVLKSAEASQLPNIEYKAEKESLWTLVMCTPDGNLENSNNEYCHLFLGNIPEDRIDQAEQIIDYLRPIPARGAGYYRYIFVLYKQSQRLDYTEYKKSQPCLQLHARNWNTLEFYRKYQDRLTPAGLAFFQSDWDSTLKQFYHSTLDAKEPMFQYDFPKPHLNPQKWFPLRQPFNLYLDRYRDPKDVTKDILLRRLRTVDPFEEPSPPLKYPNACRIDENVPSWLKQEIQKERLGWGRVNDIK